MKEALTKKLGPLPRWVWLSMAVAAGLLYMRYRANQAAANQDSQNASQDQTQGYPYDSGVGGTLPMGDGGGFDPTAFEQGVQYGESQGSGSTLSPAQGADITVNVKDNKGHSHHHHHHGGHGGKKGGHNKHTAHGNKEHENTHHDKHGSGKHDRHTGDHLHDHRSHDNKSDHKTADHNKHGKGEGTKSVGGTIHSHDNGLKASHHLESHEHHRHRR